MTDKDIKTFNDLAHEVLALREENEKLKTEKIVCERTAIKTGMILQSYGEEKEKGCEYCNPNHPEYNAKIRCDFNTPYLRIERHSEQGTFVCDISIKYCFNCGRKLNSEI